MKDYGIISNSLFEKWEGAAARDFGHRQGGEFRASPQRGGVLTGTAGTGNVDRSSEWKSGNVAIGSTINYQLSVVNGVLSLAINGATNTFNLFNNGTNWQLSANAVYFKAGFYSQTTDTCSCSNDGARVAFYSLTRYHAPTITNQPASATVNVSANVAFGVGASDWTNMTYQWWFNVTNLLAGATSSALALTNVSGASAGNYTVVVGDSFGSVTSAVATLTVTVPPVIGGASMAPDHNSFTLTGIGAASQSYVLLTTSNLTPPVTWTPVLTNNAGSNGVFSLTDTQAANYSRRFYRVATP